MRKLLLDCLALGSFAKKRYVWLARASTEQNLLKAGAIFGHPHLRYRPVEVLSNNFRFGHQGTARVYARGQNPAQWAGVHGSATRCGPFVRCFRSVPPHQLGPGQFSGFERRHNRASSGPKSQTIRVSGVGGFAFDSCQRVLAIGKPTDRENAEGMTWDCQIVGDDVVAPKIATAPTESGTRTRSRGDDAATVVEL